MKLSEFALDQLKDYVTGDNGLTPTKSGRKVVALFSSVGVREIYNNGLPEGLSRTNYAFSRLNQINDSKGLKDLLEIIFSERNFSEDTSKDIKLAVEKVNAWITPEGYRLIEVGGDYKISSNEVYAEAKESKVHFEELQGKLIAELANAKYVIWVAVAWFTDPDLYALLAKKRMEGLSIQVLILEDEVNAKSGLNFGKDFYTLKVPKTGPYENIMHHKFCVIDLKTVVHGSYNWTRKAQYNNETLDVEYNRENAEKFSDEFIKRKRAVGA